MVEANINYDFEDSEKLFSLEDNHIYIPHLIEKYNSLKSEISENNKGKKFKKIGFESLDETIFIEYNELYSFPLLSPKCGKRLKAKLDT